MQVRRPSHHQKAAESAALGDEMRLGVGTAPVTGSQVSTGAGGCRPTIALIRQWWSGGGAEKKGRAKGDQPLAMGTGRGESGTIKQSREGGGVLRKAEAHTYTRTYIEQEILKLQNLAEDKTLAT